MKSIIIKSEGWLEGRRAGSSKNDIMSDFNDRKIVAYKPSGSRPMMVQPEEAAAMAAFNTAYDIGRYAVRGVSGARKRARRRRRRQRGGVLRGAGVQSVSTLRRRPLTASAMSAPVAEGQRLKQDYSGLDKYVVRHAEYLADVKGSTDFSVVSLRINPADPITFPWLSKIAPNFEKYKFRKLRFMLKPQAPSITPGVIMMAIDYDPTDTAPVSKADLLQYDGAVRVNTWSSQELICKTAGSSLYTASVAPTASADLRLSDLANLHLATSGQLDTSLVSELWVEYEVELHIPQSRPNCDVFRINRDGWKAGDEFISTDVANPSVNFIINPDDASTLLCVRSGVYGLAFYAVQFGTRDTTIDTPLSIRVYNGATALTVVGSSEATSLPLQTGVVGISTGPGKPINAGDVLSFDSNLPGLLSSIRLTIYPSSL